MRQHGIDKAKKDFRLEPKLTKKILSLQDGALIVMMSTSSNKDLRDQNSLQKRQDHKDRIHQDSLEALRVDLGKRLW